MQAKTILTVLLISVGIAVQSCKRNNPVDPKSEQTVPKIGDILNGNDQNLINLLNKVRGSVGRRGPGSKTIWSRKNDYGLGLYISANHVFNISAYSGESLPAFRDESLPLIPDETLPVATGLQHFECV